jgi:hypothetical protein
VENPGYIAARDPVAKNLEILIMVEARHGEIEATPINRPVEAYLDMLEDMIDPEHQAAVEDRQLKSFRYEPIDHIPVMVTLRDDVSHQTFGNSEWPTFFWQEQIDNYDYMLLNELMPAYESAVLKDDKCFSIRPNLGQCFIPSLFGCEPDISEAKLDSMPWIKRDEKQHDIERIRELVGQGVPNIKGKLMDTYVEIVNDWKKRLQDYPKLQRFTHISLPDVQGPFNLAFHLRNVDLYTDIIDDPQLVHDLMNLMTETFVEVVTYCKNVTGEPMDEAYYWNWHMAGGVRNVDDNSVLLGPEQYNEFVLPYNNKAFAPFDGGAHHSCGELEHLYGELFAIEKVKAMHFGNPEFQDFGKVRSLLEEKKICILWDETLEPAHREQVTTGVVVKEIRGNLDEAKACLEEYRKNW